MKICCLANTGKILPRNYLDSSLSLTKETQFQLIVEKEYIVYTLYTWRQNVWYYICDERYTYFPIKYPAPLFSVTDSRPSRYWHMKLRDNGFLSLTFEHWFSIPNFYKKLTEQDEQAVLILRNIKN